MMRLALCMLLVLSSRAFALEKYEVKAGESLASIAELRYGHKHYALVLEKLNKIEETSLKVGDKIRIPDLQAMLFDVGLISAATTDIGLVVEARYEFMKLKGDITRALHPGNSKAPVKVPASVRDPLLKAAAKLEKAGKNLARLGGFRESPTRMNQRLGKCAKIFRDLASGAYTGDPDGPVHLLFAQTFVRGLTWARAEDKGD